MSATKFTPADLDDIRSLRAAGRTQQAIADIYGVTQVTISKVLRLGLSFVTRAHQLAGQRFGRLVAIERCGRRNADALWLCRCDCGGTKITRAVVLTRGLTTSCGCVQKERASEASLVHGGAGRGYSDQSAEYRTWRSMRARCLNPNNPKFKRYRGRGITICEAWLNDFAAFRADMGQRPDGRSIDRIDNDGNYEPGNCRWATPTEQSRNRSMVLHKSQLKTKK